MRSRNLVQVRLSVIVIPDLIREPDENILKLTTLQHTTGSRIKSGMTGMREPQLDEDVHSGCNQNVIKQNSERTQENRHLLSNRIADERKYFKLKLSALHDCTIQLNCGRNARGKLSGGERPSIARRKVSFCKAKGQLLQGIEQQCVTKGTKKGRKKQGETG